MACYFLDSGGCTPCRGQLSSVALAWPCFALPPPSWERAPQRKFSNDGHTTFAETDACEGQESVQPVKADGTIDTGAPVQAWAGLLRGMQAAGSRQRTLLPTDSTWAVIQEGSPCVFGETPRCSPKIAAKPIINWENVNSLAYCTGACDNNLPPEALPLKAHFGLTQPGGSTTFQCQTPQFSGTATYACTNGVFVKTAGACPGESHWSGCSSRQNARNYVQEQV